MITSSKDRTIKSPEKPDKTLTAKLFHNLCQVDPQRSAWHPPFSGEKTPGNNNSADQGPGMRKLPFSAAVLKWIALITMIIDHIGASFFKFYFIPHGKHEPFATTYEVLRDIGIRQRYHLVNRIDEHEAAVVQCLAGYFLTG